MKLINLIFYAKLNNLHKFNVLIEIKFIHIIFAHILTFKHYLCILK